MGCGASSAGGGHGAGGNPAPGRGPGEASARQGPEEGDARGWGVPALAGADVVLPQESRYWKVDRNLTLFAAAAKLKSRAVRLRRRRSLRVDDGGSGGRGGAGAEEADDGGRGDAGEVRAEAEGVDGVEADGVADSMDVALVEARVGVAPQSQPLPAIEGASVDTPRDALLAMGRINALRQCYGFPAWTWSPSWAEKARRHCEYYVGVAEDRFGVGHFEDPAHPLYSVEGDEAARSSGIAFGGRQLLDFLDSMLEGPLHRKQFLSRFGSSNGGAFLANADGSRACCLLPGTIDRDRAAPAPRWLMYPPEGFMDASPKFVAERPEPRPRGHRADYARGELGSTGLIVEVAITAEEDQRRYAGVSGVSWVDCCTGQGVPHWQSCPAHPSIEIDEAMWRGLYNQAMPTDPRQNHLAQRSVLLGAHSPVVPGHTFEVRMTLHLDGPAEDVPLLWRFGTRAPCVHRVVTSADMDEAQKYIGLMDTLELGPGDFSYFAQRENYWFPAGIREIRGSGADRTRLEVQTLCFQQAGFAFRDLTLEGRDDKTMLYLHNDSGAEVLLEGVSLFSTGRAGHIGRGTLLRIDGCDLAGITTGERMFCWLSEGEFLVGPKGVSNAKDLRNFNGAEWIPIAA